MIWQWECEERGIRKQVGRRHSLTLYSQPKIGA